MNCLHRPRPRPALGDQQAARLGGGRRDGAAAVSRAFGRPRAPV